MSTVENTTVIVMGREITRILFFYNSITKPLPLFSNVSCIGFGFEASSYFRIFTMEICNVFPLDCLTETFVIN